MCLVAGVWRRPPSPTSKCYAKESPNSNLAFGFKSRAESLPHSLHPPYDMIGGGGSLQYVVASPRSDGVSLATTHPTAQPPPTNDNVLL